MAGTQQMLVAQKYDLVDAAEDGTDGIRFTSLRSLLQQHRETLVSKVCSVAVVSCGNAPFRMFTAAVCWKAVSDHELSDGEKRKALVEYVARKDFGHANAPPDEPESIQRQIVFDYDSAAVSKKSECTQDFPTGPMRIVWSFSSSGAQPTLIDPSGDDDRDIVVGVCLLAPKTGAAVDVFLDFRFEPLTPVAMQYNANSVSAKTGDASGLGGFGKKKVVAKASAKGAPKGKPKAKASGKMAKGKPKGGATGKKNLSKAKKAVGKAFKAARDVIKNVKSKGVNIAGLVRSKVGFGQPTPATLAFRVNDSRGSASSKKKAFASGKSGKAKR